MTMPPTPTAAPASAPVELILVSPEPKTELRPWGNGFQVVVRDDHFYAHAHTGSLYPTGYMFRTQPGYCLMVVQDYGHPYEPAIVTQMQEAKNPAPLCVFLHNYGPTTRELAWPGRVVAVLFAVRTEEIRVVNSSEPGPSAGTASVSGQGQKK